MVIFKQVITVAGLAWRRQPRRGGKDYFGGIPGIPMTHDLVYGGLLFMSRRQRPALSLPLICLDGKLEVRHVAL